MVVLAIGFVFLEVGRLEDMVEQMEDFILLLQEILVSNFVFVMIGFLGDRCGQSQATKGGQNDNSDSHGVYSLVDTSSVPSSAFDLLFILAKCVQNRLITDLL